MLAPLCFSAEEGWSESDVAREVARQYLKDFSSEPVRSLVLGCTHYPILRKVISEVVGEDVTLIDSGEATAAEVKIFLKRSGLAHSDTSAFMKSVDCATISITFM